MKRHLLYIMVIAVGMFLLNGFDPAAAQTPAQNERPRYGGILKRHGFEPVSLGYPATMTAQTDGQQSSVCLETLFRFNEKSEIIPLLATDWKADAKSKTITLTLRKGVTFQDGTAFNAKVCKWNIDKFREGKRKELSHVASVDVLDDFTVRLNLSTFDNVIISHLTHDAGRMISQAAYEKNGQVWCEKNPVGTGPFQFVSWQKDVMIKWKRFDGYWDGKPYLDGIEMIKNADPVADIMSLKSGERHLLSVEPKDAKALEGDSRFTVLTPPEGLVATLAGNSKDPKSPFADIRVRQAVSHAIDMEAMSKAFGYGYYKPMNQWAQPGSWAFNTSVKGYPYDPARAKQLLAAAGYPNGFKTNLHYFAMLPMYTDEMTAVQQYLKQVGIDATLDGAPRPRYAEMASLAKGWDGMIRMQSFWKPDVLAQVSGWMSQGGTEFSEVIRPPELLELYDRATQAVDSSSKKKLTQDLMMMWTDKYCLATFFPMQTLTMVKSKKLHDDLFGVVPYQYHSPKAWLSE
jgi:peptide/nickel transport system substrate-binding protein